MIIALLLAAAAPMTAIDAERAFARDAQKIGQWTAFRKWARDDALMFVPQPTNAQTFLAPLKDPRATVMWWPSDSSLSCDGRTAINHGPWVRAGGKMVGTFTTVWQYRRSDGWKWTYDAGGPNRTAAKPASDAPRVTRASCRGKPRGAVILGTIGAAGYRAGGGRSADGTLTWSWTVDPKSTRHFLAQLWDGRGFVTLLDESVAPE